MNPDPYRVPCIRLVTRVSVFVFLVWMAHLSGLNPWVFSLGGFWMCAVFTFVP